MLNKIFYKTNLRWTKKFVENNLFNIEENYKLYPHKNRWNCDCHVVHDDDKNVYRIDYDFLRNKYEKLVAKVAKKYNLKKYHLSDIWYNYYKKQQYQEPHIHEGNGGLTAVHYLIYNPKKHSKTCFRDLESPDVKEGDILFFPDNVVHYVKKNKSNEPRLTVAFTVTKHDI